jgi:hypothetical protein
VTANGIQWPEVITAVVAVVSAPLAIFALFQTRSTLKEQTVSNDLQTILAIWERLDAHWVRFRTASTDAQKTFEFGQLTSYYELACGLFRDDMLATDAARTLKEHLRDILPAMLKHPEFAARFKALATKKDTFANIKWFRKMYCGRRRTRLQAVRPKARLSPS